MLLVGFWHHLDGEVRQKWEKEEIFLFYVYIFFDDTERFMILKELAEEGDESLDEDEH